MAIEKLKKLLLLGDLDSKQEILEELQKEGFVHLVPLTEPKEESTGNRYEKLREALTYLENCPRKRLPQTPGGEYSTGKLVEEILRNKRERVRATDAIDLLGERIRNLKPWGEFDYPDLDELSGYRLWFYKAPFSQVARLDDVQLPWKITGEYHNDYFFVVVANHEPDGNEVPFPRVHVGSRNLSELRDDLDAALIRLEELNAERESLTRWLKPLTQSLDETINFARMGRASGQTRDDDKFFALSGWVPESSAATLESLRERSAIAYTLANPDEDDNPPTLLKNSDQFGGGESAVSFFQLPGYRSWDPSVIIFFSFALFFAIILSDAGYAACLGLLLAFFWKKLALTQTGLRMRHFATAIVGASLAYGILTGSYFGIKIDEDGLLGQLRVLDINNFPVMMQLSIGAGVLHLVAANLISGWHHRNRLTSLSSVGWAMVISGVFILWLQYLRDEESVHFFAPSSLFATTGMALVLLFSSERKIQTLKDVALRLSDSILALYQVTRAFGDVLSYMRLFALGLSSASLAVTFNNLAVSASESVSAGGFLLFALIVLLGHVLNFILAIMSGVIHGLRLNMLEFYNWGVEGDGYPFEAFRRNK